MTMSEPSIEDLQSMFPQLPLPAIQDVVEQTGGCANAVDALLAFSSQEQRVPSSLWLGSARPRPSSPGSHICGISQKLPAAHRPIAYGRRATADNAVTLLTHHPKHNPPETGGDGAGAFGVLGLLTSMRDAGAQRQPPCVHNRVDSKKSNSHGHGQLTDYSNNGNGVVFPWQFQVVTDPQHRKNFQYDRRHHCSSVEGSESSLPVATDSFDQSSGDAGWSDSSGSSTGDASVSPLLSPQLSPHSSNSSPLSVPVAVQAALNIRSCHNDAHPLSPELQPQQGGQYLHSSRSPRPYTEVDNVVSGSGSSTSSSGSSCDDLVSRRVSAGGSVQDQQQPLPSPPAVYMPFQQQLHPARSPPPKRYSPPPVQIPPYQPCQHQQSQVSPLSTLPSPSPSRTPSPAPATSPFLTPTQLSPSTAPVPHSLPSTPIFQTSTADHSQLSPSAAPFINPHPPTSRTHPVDHSHISHLRLMFSEHQFPDDVYATVLASVGGDLQQAVNKLLDFTCEGLEPGDSAACESSSQGSSEYDSPEERRKWYINYLLRFFKDMDEGTVGGVYDAVGGDQNAAFQVLQELEAEEVARKQQMEEDQRLARQLAQQEQQQQQRAAAPVLRSPRVSPRPSAVAASPSRHSSGGGSSQQTTTPPPTPQPALPIPTPSYTAPAAAAAGCTSPTANTGTGAPTSDWASIQEQRMLACRVKLLQRMFAVPIERDLAEALLHTHNQDVTEARAVLVSRGLPLKPSQTPQGFRSQVAAPEAALGLDPDELRRLREERPGEARTLIHEHTQALYEQTRGKAQEYVEMKRHCMKRAAELFNRGEYEEAETLTLEAHRYGDMAREVHDAASSKVYSHRNNTLLNTWTVDMHGLHVDEALAKLELNITTFAPLPSKKQIRVVTGRGAHSSDNVPKVYAAVKARLEEMGHAFTLHLGYIDVFLDPPPPPAQDTVTPSTSTSAGGAAQQPAAAAQYAAAGAVPPPPPQPRVSPSVYRRPQRQEEDESLQRYCNAPAPTQEVPLALYIRQ